MRGFLFYLSFVLILAVLPSQIFGGVVLSTAGQGDGVELNYPSCADLKGSNEDSRTVLPISLPLAYDGNSHSIVRELSLWKGVSPQSLIPVGINGKTFTQLKIDWASIPQKDPSTKIIQIQFPLSTLNLKPANIAVLSKVDDELCSEGFLMVVYESDSNSGSAATALSASASPSSSSDVVRVFVDQDSEPKNSAAGESGFCSLAKDASFFQSFWVLAAAIILFLAAFRKEINTKNFLFRRSQ